MTSVRQPSARLSTLLASVLVPVLAMGAFTGDAAAQTTEPEAAETTAEAAAQPAPQADGEAAESDARSYAGDDVVATVGDKKILLREVVAVYTALPDQVRALPQETLWEGIVNQLIDETVIANAAEKSGLEDRIDVALAIQAQHRAILANAYLEDVLSAMLTDEAIEAEYNRIYADVEPVKQVRASHILLKEEDTAKGVLAEIRGGKDFAEAAREHSTGPTGPGGGDLGYFEKEQMVPQFAEAAFAMEIGEISEPVQSDFGWHLIHLVDIRDRPAPELESVRATLEEELSARLAREAVDELRTGANVETLTTSAPDGALSDIALITPPEKAVEAAPEEASPEDADNAEASAVAAASGSETDPESDVKEPITELAPESAPAPNPADRPAAGN